MRRARVYMYDSEAGLLEETAEGYRFAYHADYLSRKEAVAISLTLPLKAEAYASRTLFPFFDGLIPEGWWYQMLLDIRKLDRRDRFGQLLASGRECIGAVRVLEETEAANA